jgi:glycosyltransferase involved in cell wall biosynthesis
LGHKKILYFVPEWPTTASGVLHSTVLAEAAFVQRNIGDCFFVGTDISEQKAKEATDLVLESYGIRSNINGCYSNQYGFLSVHQTISSALKRSWSAIMEFSPTHIWADTYLTVMKAKKIAKLCKSMVVFDLPAIYCEEIAMRHGYGPRYHLTRILEKKAIMTAGRISGVSNQLKHYVQRWTGRDDMIVIPCCYNEKKFYFSRDCRNQIRGEYGFRPDDIVVCYCGGLSEWQRAEDIVKLCTQISLRKENFKFLFLTQELDRLRSMLVDFGLQEAEYRIRSCLPGEVPAYLSAADCGIIMRDDVPVNNVASPIKIGEYLGCGLPVILTKGIGDYSEMIAKTDTGLVLDENGDMARQIVDFMKNADLSAIREKAARLARDTMSWQAQASRLNELFG